MQQPGVIDAWDWNADWYVAAMVCAAEASADEPSLALDGPSFREQMEAFERNLLTKALAATGNNQSEAARRLGLNRATLYDRLKKYDDD